MIPPPLQASKWLSIQVLLSSREMKDLIREIGDFSIYPTNPVHNPLISHAEFLEIYENYVTDLQSGIVPVDPVYRQVFSTFWSCTEEAVVKVPVGDKILCRAVQPVIQLQYHLMGYSPLDGKFRPMVMGKESIHWGIQFSYPQLFQAREKLRVEKVDSTFANTALFHSVRRWMRQHTLPTPFFVNGEKTNAPIRIGRKALVWVNDHRQLKSYGIQVQEGTCA